MDAAEYRAAKAAANALRRDTFDAIVRAVGHQDPVLARRIESEARVAELAIPPQHVGEQHARWVVLAMPQLLSGEILDSLMLAEAGAVGPEGNGTAAASSTAGLVDAWRHWIEQDEA
jgi:hypothetical protein